MSDTAVVSNEMGTQIRQETPLRDSVKNALENYFAHLGSETPTNVFDMVMEQIELPLLQRVMAYTGNNQSKAAKVLGLSRGTLRKKLKIYDLL
jgi:Fis family transcriptional regulator, factor for inversion stimulation protein